MPGMCQLEGRAWLLALGVSEIVTKAYDPRRLLEAVAGALAAPAPPVSPQSPPY